MISRVRTILAAPLVASLVCPPTTWADPISTQDLLVLGRVEQLTRQGQWDAAATELGRLQGAAQDSPAAKQYMQQTLARLYLPPVPAATIEALTPPEGSARARGPAGPRLVGQTRITHRHSDAETHSDKVFDERGWQYNTQWLAEGDTANWRHTVRASVDGYQDDRNDLRPRQFSYQMKREGVRITTGDVRNYLTHHKVNDPSNPLENYTGYTLRSTQLRGLDVQLNSDQNDFHVMAGVAPYFLSASDDYIYPRQIYGARESYQFVPWYRAAIAGSYVRDRDEPIEHIDSTIQPRETGIVSVEQDLTIIPHHWAINTENAYSTTDDNLRPDRFGNNVKLKDFAHGVFSEWHWSAVHILGTYERIGPQFRAPSDIAAVGTINSKNVSADREHITLRVYPKRLGPLTSSFMYGRTQNNLSDQSDVERTREHWITAEGALDLPAPWPRPSLRGTFIRTITVPGSEFEAPYRWTYDLATDLYKQWATIDWTAGYQYWQVADDDSTGFDNEYRRAFSLQAGRGLWPGAYVSGRGSWARVQDRFDLTTMRRHNELDSGLTISSRLWSTASLSVGYDYQDLGAPIVVEPAVQTAGGGITQTVSSAFMWPYTWRLRGDRTFSLAPSIQASYVDSSDDLQRHYTVGERLTARYAIRDNWRWELMCEHRRDRDNDIADVRAEVWRVWLLLSSKFGLPAACLSGRQAAGRRVPAP